MRCALVSKTDRSQHVTLCCSKEFSITDIKCTCLFYVFSNGTSDTLIPSKWLTVWCLALDYSLSNPSNALHKLQYFSFLSPVVVTILMLLYSVLQSTFQFTRKQPYHLHSSAHFHVTLQGKDSLQQSRTTPCLSGWWLLTDTSGWCCVSIQKYLQNKYWIPFRKYCLFLAERRKKQW